MKHNANQYNSKPSSNQKSSITLLSKGTSQLAVPIDTIRLRVWLDDVNIIQEGRDHFTELNPEALIDGTIPMVGGYAKSVYKHSLDQSDYGYLPQTTIFNATREFVGREKWLSIRLSAPKLFFGDNLNELAESDFTALVRKLRDALLYMGIEIAEKNLREAHANEMHIGKNAIEAKTAQLLRRFGAANVPLTKKDATTEYADSGAKVSFHTKRWQFVAYDKRKEMKLPNLPDIFRMELRLLNAREINKAINEVATKEEQALIAQDVTQMRRFDRLFNSDLLRRIYINNLESLQFCGGKLGDPKTNILDFVAELRALNPTASLSDIEKIGLRHAMAQEAGLRNVRQVIGADNSQWSRRNGIQNRLTLPEWKSSDPLEEIRAEIERFEPVRYPIKLANPP